MPRSLRFRLPWSRRSLGPPRGEAAAGPYESRYDIAHKGYMMQLAQLARALDQATLKTLFSMTANVVLAGGIITIAMRGGVKPIFIPHDQFGRIIQYDDLRRFKGAPLQVIESELAEWLVNTRGIYYNSPVAQLDRARQAKVMLTPETERWLVQDFSAPERNPVALARELSRELHVVSIRKDPDRPLWYFQWREVDIPIAGGYTESAWQGTLRVSFAPEREEDRMWLNPAGIRIESISWNRLRQRVVAAPAQGSAQGGPRPVTPDGGGLP